ncbi:MAG: cation:dicarboxylase symporter family transporter [Myxococcota bacterium]|nr:cation:dicarboxylase symporter family transporter [Myxococcota bacterium]
MSLSTQILIGLISGLLMGLFFGAWVEPLGILGDAFVLLLQMTVLPYLAVSLMVGLGALRPEGAARLAWRAGGVLLILWTLAFGTIFLSSLAYPAWESASFFSSNLVDSGRGFDFLSLFIPANPFSSLANTVVPAVVVFSGAVGVALIGQPEKAGLMSGLQTFKDALSSITSFVVRLAPVGIFGIAARAAATISLDQARSLQVYMVAYVVCALLMALWTLPALIACLTPYRWSDVMRTMRGALITAFATGSVFVVLSVLVERSKALVREKSDDPERDEHFVDVVIPVAFTFPSVGKLLSINFVLFAGWASGYSLSYSQYPTLGIAGLASYFGATVSAIPFLLDLFQIPSDTFQMFLVADNVVGGRFGAMVAARHLVAVAFITTAAMGGSLRWAPLAIARYLVITAALTVGLMLGVHFLFDVGDHEYEGYDQLVSMQSRFDYPKAEVFDSVPASILPEDLSHDTVKRILDRGVLRVGFSKGRLPWAFRNSDGELVGFDVEMARMLASELGVGAELYQVSQEQFVPALDSGRLDVIMSGIPLTTSLLAQMSFSRPYVDETIAFVVRDHLRQHFGSRGAVMELESPQIAVPDLPYYSEKIQRYLPDAQITVLPNVRDFFSSRSRSF